MSNYEKERSFVLFQQSQMLSASHSDRLCHHQGDVLEIFQSQIFGTGPMSFLTQPFAENIVLGMPAINKTGMKQKDDTLHPPAA